VIHVRHPHPLATGRPGEQQPPSVSRGATVWITGLPAAGKTTIADRLKSTLVDQGRAAYVLDGDELRAGINSDLGFSAEDRAENIRRVAEISKLMADAGCVVAVALVSPLAGSRAEARAINERAGVQFIEVYADAPASVCEERDPKGHYQRARAGEIPGFTGIDHSYEPPGNPDVRVGEMTPDEAVMAILLLLDS